MHRSEKTVPTLWNILKNCIFKTALNRNRQTGRIFIVLLRQRQKSIGLFWHSDVVAVNNDWIHTSPFIPIEKDGFIIGRGVLDDKAAIIISLYCAKILKELNIPFNSQLIMFTGSNEETGMEDIDNY